MPPDDYIHCNITQKQDWIDLYATPYYFGCEADDRMNAVAFGKTMPLGARINAIYSSDIGHFDVVDMRDPLPEAFELVEDGHITEDDFHDFVFANAVRLWGTQNPRFFEGTAVAKEAAALLKRGAPTRATRRNNRERGRLARISSDAHGRVAPGHEQGAVSCTLAQGQITAQQMASADPRPRRPREPGDHGRYLPMSSCHTEGCARMNCAISSWHRGS